MLRISSISAKKWPEKALDTLISALSFLVFAFLDLLDIVLCIFYRFFDYIMEGNSHTCYCYNRARVCDGGHEISETLYERKNIFRELGFLKLRGKGEDGEEKGALLAHRWSDCRCESCVSWQGKRDQGLHLIVMEPSKAMDEDCRGSSAENVIFLHGFLSSSSFWTETVFPNLSENAKLNYRLFAVDLLGFGRSPKPSDSKYRLNEHVEMIERSVLEPLRLASFHLVAHSMGCIIALALATKHLNSVKSITLIATPYFPSTKENASHTALNRLAQRRLWPPLLFGASIMACYEHLGRTVCFIICRNHKKWERMLKLLTLKRDLHFRIMDFTRHTHHSAWHSMHNVICGGAKMMDNYLQAVNRSRALVTLIQGDKDQVVPLECCCNVKLKVPLAEVKIISKADHKTIIIGREKDFTRDLEQIWSSAENHNPRNML
ncbi:putative lysophospholipase BODYGUARD 4 [Tasmannia lanceolata]|uniref:putative lysophospholipase BODYGUARD 4 n=1 Tax=Tasmannia lanceolata TaxID=3420 RepID=UPI00406391FD